MGKLEVEVNEEPTKLPATEEDASTIEPVNTVLKSARGVPFPCSSVIYTPSEEGKKNLSGFEIIIDMGKDDAAYSVKFRPFPRPNFIRRFLAWLLLGVTYHKY